MTDMSFSSKVDTYERALRVDESFDISKRELVLGGRKSVLYFIDGCVKDDIVERLLEFLMSERRFSDAELKDPVSFINAHSLL